MSPRIVRKLLKVDLRPTRLLAFLLLSLTALAAVAAPVDHQALLQALRGGGYNLYFRHVATDWSQSDRVDKAGDWRSCDATRMRQLSSAGREDARSLGVAMRALHIPVGEVLASPYCRTVETARLMQLGDVVETIQVMNLRTAEFVGGRASVVASARALLASTPAVGNRLIVAHGNVAREATPAYPDEGEALVFQADGSGGFLLKGRIGVNDWPRLLALDAE